MDMRHLALLALATVLLSGCLARKLYDNTAGRVVNKVGKVYAKVLPSYARGAVGGAVVVTPTVAPVAPGFSSQDVAMVTQIVEEDRRQRAERPRRQRAERPARHEAPAPRRDDRVAQRPAPNVSNDFSFQHTRKEAPRYPSSPFVALYPAKKGSKQTVCKKFQQSADNKNDCMVECRSQLTFGPGSCSCNEMTECPSGTRVLD